MDARRLGMSPALPLAFLEVAAPGYLPDAEWDTLGEDWAEQALAYTAEPCKGARGPLTRIRPRPARPRRAGAAHGGDGARPQEPATGPAFQLADYLDQHGRAERAAQIPPPDFWAAATHAAPNDQAALANAAHNRGLYRDAAQMHKNAAAVGNLDAVLYLSHPPAACAPTPAPPTGPPTTSLSTTRAAWAGAGQPSAGRRGRAGHRAAGTRPRHPHLPRQPGRRSRAAGQPSGGGRGRAGHHAGRPGPSPTLPSTTRTT